MKNQKLFNAIITVLIMMHAACSSPGSIKGTWQYDGGIYNGKAQKASKDFRMQREYSENQYNAYMYQEGSQPVKYASGKYELEGDSLLVTGEFSSQPSQFTGKTIAYQYKLENDKLTINGKLPNGMVVEEYWKKIK